MTSGRTRGMEAAVESSSVGLSPGLPGPVLCAEPRFRCDKDVMGALWKRMQAKGVPVGLLPRWGKGEELVQGRCSHTEPRPSDWVMPCAWCNALEISPS